MERAKFAGGDQGYLRDEQYADSSRLSVRAALHERYGTANEPWYDFVRVRVDLHPGAVVLEVGCGGGWLWGPSAVSVPADVALTLVDLSPGMVDEAVARSAASGSFASVDGRPADAQALPYPDDSFDRVIANHMLYHLPEPEQGVAELRRVLRPGGLAIVATNGPNHLLELSEAEAEVLEGPMPRQTVEVFGSVTGDAVLRRHFASVAWDPYEDQLLVTDLDDALAYICSSPPGEDATPAQRAELRAAIERRAVGGVLTVTKDSGLFRCRAKED